VEHTIAIEDQFGCLQHRNDKPGDIHETFITIIEAFIWRRPSITTPKV
jgi:hypothetical protein